MVLKENHLHSTQQELIIFIKIFMKASNFFLHYGDLADSNSLVNVVNKVKPHEIYNLGAQSHVGHSFEIPEYTSEVTGLGTLRILETMRFLNLKKHEILSSKYFRTIWRKKLEKIHLMKNP